MRDRINQKSEGSKTQATPPYQTKGIEQVGAMFSLVSDPTDAC
ncbi:hypothetical protein ACOJUY_004261 [Vibrio alginolyticus]|nr:hypothetical protein [Vibrio diabolicus]MCQ9247886.1 hypothetical protein [Vibrio diabolicus]MDF4677000.1 hypothetical protein [Vibrio parahaemolyticus]